MISSGLELGVKRIVYCSLSPLKVDALKESIAKVKEFEGIELVCVDSQPTNNPQQPINSGYECSVNRINHVLGEYNQPGTVIIAIESEFRVCTQEKWAHDVANATIKNGEELFTAHSYGIAVPYDYYLKAEARSDPANPVKELGLTITLGKIINEENPEIPHNNWQGHAKFGGIDRKEHIKDALVSVLQKFVISTKFTITPNFPKPGVFFKDMSLVLSNKITFNYLCDAMKQRLVAEGWDKSVTKVMGFDARGFIYGSLVARALGCGFIMIRKKGKLPGDTIKIVYKTEYSEDILELVNGTIDEGDKILLVDDVIATGGTFGAGVRGIKETGKGEVIGCFTVMKVEPLVEVAKKHLGPVPFISLF